MLLGFIVAAPNSLAAQGTFEQLTVSLMPQYDDPRLLIVYEATLDAAGEVRLAVPGAVELRRAAFRAADGTLQQVEAAFEGASDGRFVRFASPEREVRLELYQDSVSPAPNRFVDFTLPAQRFPVGALRWLVVFPLESTDLATQPPMTHIGENHIGMAQFARDAGPLPAGQTAAQTIEWRRDSNAPSIVLPDDEPAARSLRPLYLAAALVFALGLALTAHGLWRATNGTKGHEEKP